MSSHHSHRRKFIRSDNHHDLPISQDSFFTPFSSENRLMSPAIELDSTVRSSTIGYIDLLKKCDKTLDFSTLITKRALTTPSTPAHNDSRDNAKYDYILYTDEVIGTGVEGANAHGKKAGTRYRVLCLLGQGAFGQVVKCFDEINKTFVAIKVLKNRPAYYRQAMLEIAVLETLNDHFDKDGSGHTLRLLDHFVFHNHVCIVNELLSINLYELMKQNNCKPLTVQLARSVLVQLCEALVVLYRNGIVHCDLKPENVLLVDMTKKIKLIDFGSACFENSTLYSYIQSRHYRSPEVILGLPYNTAIDMWSYGCMAAELFVGIPVFPGNSEYNMLYKFINMLGMPPKELLDKGTKTTKFFRRKKAIEMRNSNDVWVFKTKREFEEDNNVYTEPNREYFSYKTLEDIAMKVSFKVVSNEENRKTEYRYAFLDFLKKCLQWDPEKRMRPDQALHHPFLTKKPFMMNVELPPTDEPLRSFPPNTQLTADDVLHRIAPNPQAAQKLKTMGYNATTYYQIYTDGLNKGVILNILNSNPFYLNPMTPPALIRSYQMEEERRRQRMREEEEKRKKVFEPLTANPLQRETMQNHGRNTIQIKPRSQTSHGMTHANELNVPIEGSFGIPQSEARSMRIDQSGNSNTYSSHGFMMGNSYGMNGNSFGNNYFNNNSSTDSASSWSQNNAFMMPNVHGN